MLKRAALSLVFLVLASAAPAWADHNYNEPSADPAPQFITALEDVPLMPGLRPVEDHDVLFIARSGKIAEVTVRGGVDIDEVYDFYVRSLPQLGWEKITPRLYTRGAESLSIEAHATDEDALTTVLFSAKPN
jgi:hypothetical protein